MSVDEHATVWPPLPTARASSGTFVPYDWSPPPAPGRRPPRWRRVLWTAVAVALVAAAGGLGWLSYHNHSIAEQWQSRDRAQATQVAALRNQLQQADARMAGLDSQVSSLDAQMASLQQQLSTASSQKQSAVNQEATLQQLLTAAGNVADDLQQCIDATNHFNTDLNSIFGGGGLHKLTSLQSEADKVDSTCSRAESANSNLQKAIQNAT